MVDFSSKLSGFVKKEAQSFVQKNINQVAGKLSNLGGGVVNSLIGSVTQGLSQNLFEIGNAFNTIEAVAAQKMDGIVSGGSPEFASGGKCADRSTKADLSSRRNPSGGTLKSYQTDVFPETVIDQKNTWDKNNMIILDRASDTYFMKLRFHKYDRTELFNKAKSDQLYSVVLPLPLELQDRISAKFSEEDGGTIGNLVNNAGTLSASDSMNIDKIKESLSTAVGTGAGAAMILAGDIAGNIKFDVGGINTKSAISIAEQLLGVAPNPNPSVLFKGPALREFNFSWMFNPRNKDESNRVKEAIKKMKGSSLPSTTFGSDTGLLTYPHVAFINMYPWDKGTDVSNGIYGWGENSFMRFKRCFISGISANYAPIGGAPSFFAGTNAPQFIQLSISFKEIEFFIASDWDETNKNSGSENIKNQIEELKTFGENLGL